MSSKSMIFDAMEKAVGKVSRVLDSSSDADTN